MAKKDVKVSRPESESSDTKKETKQKNDESKNQSKKQANKSSGGVSCMKTCFLLISLSILGLVGKINLQNHF
jgi:cytoskeletal protein RodZ